MTITLTELYMTMAYVGAGSFCVALGFRDKVMVAISMGWIIVFTLLVTYSS